MKRCPTCGRTYTDDGLNFCLEDGEFLTGIGDETIQTSFGNEAPRSITDDAPPTIMMDAPRVTNQTQWPANEPLSPWQPQQANVQRPPFGSPSFVRSADQTLPTISLVLGILGLVGMCCYGGMPIGAAAVITGYIGMKNADSNPARYGGRGMAIGGMVLGVISFLAGMLLLMIILLAG